MNAKLYNGDAKLAKINNKKREHVKKQSNAMIYSNSSLCDEKSLHSSCQRFNVTHFNRNDLLLLPLPLNEFKWPIIIMRNKTKIGTMIKRILAHWASIVALKTICESMAKTQYEPARIFNSLVPYHQMVYSLLLSLVSFDAFN